MIGRGSKELKALRARLKEASTFRNVVVHANWFSLTKESYVRSKIVVNGDEGHVQFRKVKLTPADIRRHISKMDQLERDLDEFSSQISNVSNLLPWVNTSSKSADELGSEDCF